MTETARDCLDRLPLSAFRLTSGRSLEAWLAHETHLDQDQAARAMLEYRRYLALVLAEPKGQTLIPSPRVAEVWRFHREYTRAYARFLAETGTEDRLHHQLGRVPLTSDPAYAACRVAYAASFGRPSGRWWPSPLLISFRLWAPWGFVLCLLFNLVFDKTRVTGLPSDLAVLGQWASLALIIFLPLTIRLVWPRRGSTPG